MIVLYVAKEIPQNTKPVTVSRGLVYVILAMQGLIKYLLGFFINKINCKLYYRELFLDLAIPIIKDFLLIYIQFDFFVSWNGQSHILLKSSLFTSSFDFPPFFMHHQFWRRIGDYANLWSNQLLTAVIYLLNCDSSFTRCVF